MPRKSGRRIRLPLARVIVSDLLDCSASVATIPVKLNLEHPELPELLLASQPRISWTVALMKAWAITVFDCPKLRQIYLRVPWPHLVQHESTDCSLVVKRNYQNQEVLFMAKFRAPDQHPLPELQQKYEEYCSAPLENIKRFQRQLSISRLPFWVRQPLCWTVMNLLPGRRVRTLGAFGMSMCMLDKGEPGYLLSPLTTMLGYGRLRGTGATRLLYCFDHRVLDGLETRAVYQKFNSALRGPVAEELRRLCRANGGKSAEQVSEPEERPQLQHPRLERRAVIKS